jgi:hypothetical protein
MVKAALLAYIQQPPQMNPGATERILARMENSAGKIERQTQVLSVALDMGYASETGQREIQSLLTDIALSVGVLAGSLVPVDTSNEDWEPGKAGNVTGSDSWRKNFG